MKDVCIFLIAVPLAFLFGMGVTALFRLLGQQKQDSKRRRTVTDSWRGLATWGILWSLSMTMLKVVQRDLDGVQTYLVEFVLFIFVFFGAWFQARRFQKM